MRPGVEGHSMMEAAAEDNARDDVYHPVPKDEHVPSFLHRVVPLGGLCCAIIFLAGFCVLPVYFEFQSYATAQRLVTFSEGVRVAESLGAKILSALYATEVLGAVVKETNGTIPHRWTELVDRCRDIWTITNMQLAPNGVVQYVHPLAGNEAAIGHDLLAEGDERAKIARLTLQERVLMVAGPMVLEGGVAIIGRLPVFIHENTPNETFFGFATVLTQMSLILEDYGTLGYQFQIASKNPNTEQWELFYTTEGGLLSSEFLVMGYEKNTTLEDAVFVDLEVPGGVWAMSFKPSSGWSQSFMFYILVVAMPLTFVCGTAGALRLWLSFAELSEQRQQTDRINRLLSTTIDSLAEGVLVTDEDGRTILGNQSSYEILKDAGDNHISDHNINDVLRLRMEKSAAAVPIGHFVLRSSVPRDQNEKITIAKCFLAHKDVPVAVTITELCSDGVGLVIVIRDRTYEIIAEKERIASQHKSRFLSIMSHEMRTPLNGIIGMVELLMKTRLSPRQLELIDVMSFSARALLALISDVLDFSKLEERKVELDIVPFSLETNVRSLHKLMSLTASAKDITLDVHFGNVPEWVEGDWFRINQILLNLVSNAIKFTPNEGNVSVRVTMDDEWSKSKWDDLQAYREDPLKERLLLHFAVKDTGIGISEPKLKLLFQEFQQADASTSRQYGGTGLGLAISRRIARLMNGDIFVSSQMGQGSTFDVLLGVQPYDGILRSVVVPEIKDDSSRKIIDRHKLGILVADDNATNRIVLGGLLNSLDFVDIRYAIDGEEARGACERNQFDVCFMDAQMPRLDGCEATRAIRTFRSMDELIIIAVTADVTTDNISRCMDVGMNGFLPKPLTLDALEKEMLKFFNFGEPLAVSDSISSCMNQHFDQSCMGLKASLPGGGSFMSLFLMSGRGSNDVLVPSLDTLVESSNMDESLRDLHEYMNRNRTKGLSSSSDFDCPIVLGDVIATIPVTPASTRVTNATAQLFEDSSYSEDTPSDLTTGGILD